jgi:hypothetical protein
MADQSTTCDVLVIGAGAAGLMCAIEAGRRGRRAIVIDHADKPAEKIRISGGGRCNFTNLHVTPKQFLSQNPHFCVSALKRYTQHDFIARVTSRGIAWHEKTLGQLFCDGSARQIIDMLLDDLTQAGGELRLGVEPGAVTREGDGFSVPTSQGAIRALSVVVATGGKSIPKMGASGYAYDVAKAFGLKIVEPRPALVPFTLADAASAIFVWMVFLYYRRYCGVFSSEVGGLTWGLLSLWLLLQSINTRSLATACMGLAALSLGSNIRAGALLVLPMLFLWILITLKRGHRIWRIVVIGAVAMTAGFVASTTVTSAVG